MKALQTFEYIKQVTHTFRLYKGSVTGDPIIEPYATLKGDLNTEPYTTLKGSTKEAVESDGMLPGQLGTGARNVCFGEGVGPWGGLWRFRVCRALGFNKY